MGNIPVHIEMAWPVVYHKLPLGDYNGTLEVVSMLRVARPMPCWVDAKPRSMRVGGVPIPSACVCPEGLARLLP